MMLDTRLRVAPAPEDTIYIPRGTVGFNDADTPYRALRPVGFDEESIAIYFKQGTKADEAPNEALFHVHYETAWETIEEILSKTEYLTKAKKIRQYVPTEAGEQENLERLIQQDNHVTSDESETDHTKNGVGTDEESSEGFAANAECQYVGVQDVPVHMKEHIGEVELVRKLDDYILRKIPDISYDDIDVANELSKMQDELRETIARYRMIKQVSMRPAEQQRDTPRSVLDSLDNRIQLYD